MKATIHKQIGRILDRTIRLRHRLHQRPEGAFDEARTSEIIAAELVELGLDPRTHLAETGVTAVIQGGRDGPVVALRAEMDALAMDEATGKPYASQHTGYAHACGHDGHMAMLVAAAQVLTAVREKLAGSVRLIFQPAEENGQGARAMIEAGALGRPLPVAIFALHSWPGLAAGMLASRAGGVTSACDVFRVTVHGRGGHGARPTEARSPILAGADVARAVSELTHPSEPSPGAGGNGTPRVISVGAFHAGTRPNVIPETACLEGTIRSGDETIRRELHSQLRRAVAGRCDAAGVSATVEIESHCGAVHNAPHLYELFTDVVDEFLGPKRRVLMPEQSAGSEDFSYYLSHVPGLLARIGVGAASPALHNPAFDFADEALPAGIAALAGLALRAGERLGAVRTGGAGE